MHNVNTLMHGDPLVKLVQRENFVGWVYGIDYGAAQVMVNDLWKSNALGVPHNCFLVATVFDPDQFALARSEEREVVLLRVVGSTKLPQDSDMVRTRIDHLKDQPGIFVADGARDYDPITQNEMQFGGLECRILGTFYSKDGDLWLGSDLESFATAAKLKVYRPRGSALKRIVNHVDPNRRRSAQQEAEQLGITAPIEPFRIGTVRYTSSDRLHRRDAAELVPVSVQPSDLLARRTAVLGMTRTGKSNMVKQMVSVVKDVADKGSLNIGQIIYDINGEYANANQQDQGAIADVFPEETVRYRMMKTDGFEDLRNNFYEQLNEGFNTIRRELEDTGVANQAGYIRGFVNMSFDEPDTREVGEHKRWEVRVAAYKVLLSRAGFSTPAGLSVRFEASADVRSAVARAASRELKTPMMGLSLSEADQWFMALREANLSSQLMSSSGKPWIDDSLQILLDMIAQKQGGTFISGSKILTPAVKYHSHQRRAEVASEIYNHLVSGKIVILDLSVGDPAIRENVSKQIARHLFRKSMETFIDGRMPPNIVVYIEEAHNLIGKELDLTDTWPRLAKEGAKYRIGLVYATQEVSSVHPNILANTENWFVTHLNNEREIKELARFYDFADFSQSLLRAQDVGFARVKTLSGPFVVPVQIDKFDPNRT